MIKRLLLAALIALFPAVALASGGMGPGPGFKTYVAAGTYDHINIWWTGENCDLDPCTGSYDMGLTTDYSVGPMIGMLVDGGVVGEIPFRETTLS